jgi:SAM-dependent methyltransferase
MNKDHIKEYWESQGETHGESHWASWGDNWMIDLETDTIGKYIKDGDTVLDIGCANMVAAAQKTKQQKGLGDNINYFEGDVRSLQFPDNSFDIAYTTRVLINLPTWEQQMQGIAECIRVVKPNGIVVLSEGFWEPLMLLNAMRSLKNLPPLVEHDFNRYLKLSALEEHLKTLGLSYQIEDFSSIYYLGSRFLRDLVTDTSAYPGFTNPINKLFYEIEKQFSGGGMGVQQAVIITKGASA